MTEASSLATEQLLSDVQAGKVSPVDITRQYIKRIQDRQDLGSFLYIDAEGALAQAASIEQKQKSGQSLGSLAGLVIGLKDNLCTRGVPTTCASKILEGYVPPYDAHVIEKLRQADAILIGKLNMDEFAMGSSNENSAVRPVKNPWNLNHVPGGSSGGSAAAVAANLCHGALGSDTGGSVRQPGAFCGVVAVKPTYGRVSRYGLIAFASSLDQIGPFAKDAKTSARLLQAIAGYDHRDATSAERPVDDYISSCDRGINGMKIGVVTDSLTQGTDPQVSQKVQQAIEFFREHGCETVEVDLPHSQYAVAIYYLIAPAEASSNLARFDGMRYGMRAQGKDLLQTYMETRAQGFGAEVKRRIMLGTYALSAGYYDAYYLQAQKARTSVCSDFDSAFQSCDLIITPTSPTPAFAFGSRKDPIAMYLEDKFTLPASLAGLPAANIPCGFSEDGLPIGMHVCAPAFEEAKLFQLAGYYQKHTNWHQQQPPDRST